MQLPEIDLAEFHNEGFLLEANRRFFHPLGLALFIRYDESGNAIELGVYDFRGDPEGTRFAEITTEDRSKAELVQQLWDEKAHIRVEKFGSVIQPLE